MFYGTVLAYGRLSKINILADKPIPTPGGRGLLSEQSGLAAGGIARGMRGHRGGNRGGGGGGGHRGGGGNRHITFVFMIASDGRILCVENPEGKQGGCAAPGSGYRGARFQSPISARRRRKMFLRSESCGNFD